MNEQLRKAIEEATESESIYDYAEAQAKLLRVIEVLVEQRNDLYELFDVVTPSLANLDAELIAALEGK